MTSSLLSLKLASHIKRCNDPNCACADFAAEFHTLPKKYPLVLEDWSVPDYVKQESNGYTWVNARISNTSFSWNCLACSHADGTLRQTAGTYATWISESFKPSNLRRHQTCPSHMTAVCNLLRIKCPENTTKPEIAPPLPVFVGVFKAFVKGIPPRKGYKLAEGLVGQRKALRILSWLIFEAFNDKHRDALKNAETVCIMRDERKMHEHIRFRCTSRDGTLTTGFLGQTKLPDPSALGLNQATYDVMRISCTKWYDMPGFLESNATPQLCQTAFDNL